MQLRGIFLSAAFCSSLFAQAQKTELAAIQAPSRVLQMDSLISRSADKKFIAGNLPVKTPFTGVPLAGQKEYFGTMTDFVNGYVRQYHNAHNKTLVVTQERGNNKFSLIDNVLERHDIPRELKYLAVIESALNNRAVSPVGAMGPWQFMESTARLLGLTVNGKRDERTDWFKSTTAAAKYLKILHNQFQDWLLVVAAYNCGPTPVMRAIDRTGSHSFWDIKKFLPRETQGHVLAFVATASIFEKMKKYIGQSLPDDFIFGNEVAAAKKEIAPPKPLYTKEELESMAIVRITEPVSAELLQSELGIDKKQFSKWNPDYDLFVYNTYEGEFYRLRIPKDKLDGFVEKKDYITKRSRQIFQAELM